MELRDAILRLLKERGELDTSELAALLGVPRHRVLRMLNKLYFEGLVEPVKKDRKYFWRLSSGYVAIAPLHFTASPVFYIEGVIEPIYKKVQNRVDTFIFTHVKNKECWMCDCGTGFYVLTDQPIDGCDCKLRHVFSERKLAMIYLAKEYRFRYWRSYRYSEDDVEFVILLPEEKDAPDLVEKFRAYEREEASSAT